jgi:FkbM family methyltransferase
MQFLNALIRKVVWMAGYELKSRNEFLPPATLENICMLLAYFMVRRGTSTLLQIGACDGTSGDPVYKFLRQGNISAVLIEPIEQSFVKLTSAYAGVSNVTAVRAAVGERDGEATLFKVKESAKSLHPYWSMQLASFNRSHLLAHGVPESEIEQVRVPCLTLGSIVEKYCPHNVDILQVDTEGFDAEVVRMALNLSTPPPCINFENLHLDESTKREIFGQLESSGYLWTHDKWNTLALHKTLVDEWTALPGISSVNSIA